MRTVGYKPEQVSGYVNQTGKDIMTNNPVQSNVGGLAGFLKNTAVGAINTVRLPYDMATGQGQRLQSDAKSSFIAPITNLADQLGTNMGMDKVLNDKLKGSQRYNTASPEDLANLSDANSAINLKIADPTSTVIRKGAAAGASAELNAAMFALPALRVGKTIDAAGNTVPLTVSKTLTPVKEANLFGTMGAGSNVANLGTQDNITPSDVIKAAVEGYASNAALPIAGKVIKKAAPYALDPAAAADGVIKLSDKIPGKSGNQDGFISATINKNPRVTGFDDQYKTLQIAYDNAPTAAAKKRISKAMAANRQARMAEANKIAEGGYVSLGGDKPVEAPNTEPIAQTKKVKTVFQTDKVLKGHQKTINDIVRTESMADPNARDVIKEVKDAGGIGSTDIEDVPKSVMSKDGRSADYIARDLGFNSDQELIDAIHAQKDRPKASQMKEDAISRLANGRSPYSKDYQEAVKNYKQRQDELSLLPVDARVTNTKPSALSEAEWNSIAERAPEQATTKKQAIGSELAGVRAELESLQGTKSQLNERQRLQVISGNQKVAGAMRESNAVMQKRINDLKIKERDLAKQYAQESGSELNTGKNMSSAETAQEFAPKSLKDKQTKQKFMGATGEYVGSLKASELDAQMKTRQFSDTHKLTDEQNLEFLKAVDDPTYKTTDKVVQAAVDSAHSIYDQAYKDFTDKGIKMGYQESYHPRIYKHPVTGEPITGPEFNLYTRSSRQSGRNADSVNVDNLITKKPAEAMKMYFASINKAAAGQKYLRTLENEGLVQKSTDPIRGMRPILGEGMQSPDGMFYYAKKDVADKLNNMFGNKETSNAIEMLAEKGAGVNSAFQSFVLSGGIPNTPVNAFGFMQIMKEAMALHPIKAGKAFYTGLNKDFASKLFTDKAEIIKRMAENGVDIRVDLDAIAKKGMQRISETDGAGRKLNRAWDEFTNDATFKRFMPALEVMHFENVEKGLVKRGMAPAEAAKKAAESTKNFYGKTDMAREATRSKLTYDATGAVLFAPRFRESMLNFWGKNIKALDPRGGFKNARSVEYRDNIKFLASAAAVYAAMDGANYALNGTHMYQNPDGKKDKLLIPYGDKYIGIPYLPSIGTVPRNAAAGAFNLATGNLNEVGKNVKSFLSMPLNTAADIITNENYFGAPIVQKDSSGGERATQVAAYVAKNNMQPWVREGLNKALQSAPDSVKKPLGIKDQSNLQTISQATELPLRFYDAANMKGGTGNFGKDNPAMVSAKGSNAQSDSTKELAVAKASALKKFGFTGKSEKDIQALADGGDQKAKDAIDNLSSLKTAYGDAPKEKTLSDNKITNDAANKLLASKDRLASDTAKETWGKKYDSSAETLYTSAKGLVPSNMGELPKTNATAEAYVSLLEKRAKGLTAVGEIKAKNEFLSDAFGQTYSKEAKEISAMSKKQKDAYLADGTITQAQYNEAVAYTNMKNSITGKTATSGSGKKAKKIAYTNILSTKSVNLRASVKKPVSKKIAFKNKAKSGIIKTA